MSSINAVYTFILDFLTLERSIGYYNFLAQTSKPYISAMWKNFSSEKETITEDVLSGRMLGRTWRAINGWFLKSDKMDESESS